MKKKRPAIIPKFDMDDLVTWENEHSHNPCYKVLSIGKIEGIHLYRGTELFLEQGETKAKDLYGRIVYIISGCSEYMDQHRLSLWKEKKGMNEKSFVNKARMFKNRIAKWRKRKGYG